LDNVLIVKVCRALPILRLSEGGRGQQRKAYQYGALNDPVCFGDSPLFRRFLRPLHWSRADIGLHYCYSVW
jgi:hypothetical protein